MSRQALSDFLTVAHELRHLVIAAALVTFIAYVCERKGRKTQ